MSAPAFAPTRTVLDNGMTILHQHNRVSDAVTVTLSFPAGSVLDPEHEEGLASLVARGLTRGTKRRTKSEIGEILDFRGADLSGSAGRHSAGLVGKARAQDWDAVLELLVECARHATFPDAEVAKLFGDRLTALREDDDDPAAVVGKVIRELIYPADHPYHRRHLGTPESVDAIEAGDLRAFHGRTFRPSAALLVVVGGVEAERALATIESATEGWRDEAPLGGYRAARVRVADAPALDGPRERRVSLPDKLQADIALGHPGIRRDDPRYHAAALMNAILGRFAMGGRLGRTVREERGMAYYTYSALDATLGPGPFVVRAGVAPGNVDVTVEAILAEMRHIRDVRVDVAELDDAKAATVRSLPRTLESNEGMAGLLHQLELHGLGLDYLDRFPGLIDAVTVDDVHRAAREILHPDAYGVAVAGPEAPEPSDDS